MIDLFSITIPLLSSDFTEWVILSLVPTLLICFSFHVIRSLIHGI